MTPAVCVVCEGSIWGKGLSCKTCGIAAHAKCELKVCPLTVWLLPSLTLPTDRSRRGAAAAGPPPSVVDEASSAEAPPRPVLPRLLLLLPLSLVSSWTSTLRIATDATDQPNQRPQSHPLQCAPRLHQPHRWRPRRCFTSTKRRPRSSCRSLVRSSSQSASLRIVDVLAAIQSRRL